LNFTYLFAKYTGYFLPAAGQPTQKATGTRQSMVCVLALQVKRIRRWKPSQHKLAPSIFFFFFKRRRGGRRRKQGGSTNLALDRRKPNEQDNRRGKNHRAHNPKCIAPCARTGVHCTQNGGVSFLFYFFGI